MFVESGLGVRLKFDLANTVHLTVTEEHSSATRGLCGIFNNNADGEGSCVNTTSRKKKVTCAWYKFQRFSHEPKEQWSSQVTSISYAMLVRAAQLVDLPNEPLHGIF